MRFFAYWLSVLVGTAFFLALAALNILFIRWVEAQTGSALIGAGGSFLLMSLFIAWFMTSALVSRTIGGFLTRQRTRTVAERQN